MKTVTMYVSVAFRSAQLLHPVSWCFQVTYSIVSGNDNNNNGTTPRVDAFSVNAISGRVFPSSLLNWELMIGVKYYDVVFHLTDNGSPSLSTQIVMRVNIVDRNDNPELTSVTHFAYPEGTVSRPTYIRCCDSGFVSLQAGMYDTILPLFVAARYSRVVRSV
jgi:hypothetical protein